MIDIITVIACVLYILIPAVIGWKWAEKTYKIEMDEE